MPTRGLVGVLLAMCVVVGGLAGATRGFTALTSDTARMLDVARRPVPVTPLALVDRRGRPHAVRDAARSTIVDVIYTRCVTVCTELGGVFQQLQSLIRTQGLTDRVRLLSVSFDPAWDTPARLDRYAALMRADSAIWTLTASRDPAALTQFLRVLGIRVIADGRNGFVHNAALHVIDPKGRLVAIVPVGASDEAIAVALRHAPERVQQARSTAARVP